MLRFQDAIYPANFAKIRFVENHDQARIMKLALSRESALAWTAFEAFNRGAFLIYGGQESAADHTPSLFDVDKIAWKDYEFTHFLKALTAIKKNPIVVNGKFCITGAEPVIKAVWNDQDASLLGLFNVNRAAGTISIPLPDGKYQDMLGGNDIQVSAGHIAIPESAVIVKTNTPLPDLHPFQSDLLDFQYSE
jgi:hypothetical protein